jgi:hypothetical protein
MVGRWREGFDVVSAVRTASGELDQAPDVTSVHWLMNRLSDTGIVPDAADFVLLSAAAFEALARCLNGTVSCAASCLDRLPPGLRTTTCLPARAGGRSTWARMIRFGLDAVFSFTTAPIRSRRDWVR